MTLTPGGSRLLATASQIVVLGAEAHAAVRAAQGAPEQLRVVATATFAEFVVSPLIEAFTRRFAGPVEVSAGVAVSSEMPVLVGQPAGRRGHRPRPGRRTGAAGGQRADLPVPAGRGRPPGSPAARRPQQWRWLVDPSGTDPGSATGQLLAAAADPGGPDRRVPEPDRRLGGRGRRGRGRARGRAPGRPAAAAGRAGPGRRCRAPRWTRAGTRPCWSGRAAARPRARCAASWPPRRPCS